MEIIFRHENLISGKNGKIYSLNIARVYFSREYSFSIAYDFLFAQFYWNIIYLILNFPQLDCITLVQKIRSVEGWVGRVEENFSDTNVISVVWL